MKKLRKDFKRVKRIKSIKLEHDNPNRGSVIYVKEEYYDKITEPENKKIGSEIIHILLNTLPLTNIIEVYQEMNITIKKGR